MSLPERIGRYLVRRRLGAGGFATVWLAHDEHLDSPVAVKVLADNWASDHAVRSRFVEEGRYLRRVDSPHVVAVHDAGELDDGRPFLVMTYADQGTLADHLAEEAGAGGGRDADEGLDPAVALALVRDVAAGLGALHARGIVHRDVKPANVLFRTDHGRGGIRALLGDLGLGKALDASSRLTMIAGSPSYVAPEQAAGESPDARADQYSLAVLTYRLLAGALPAEHATLRAAVAGAPQPRPLSQCRPDLPPAVADVVARGLARDRDERWPDVAAYAAALAGALTPVVGEPVAPVSLRPLTGPPRPAGTATPATGLGTTGLGTTGPAGASDRVPDGPSTTLGDRRRSGGPLVPVLVGVLAAALGLVGGWTWQQQRDGGLRAVEDATGSLSLEVPEGWTTLAADGWQPPTSDGEDGSTTYPAVAVGSGPTWRTEGEGAFVALLPGTDLPERLPTHPECGGVGPSSRGSADGRPQVTATSTGCPGGAGVVVVERVEQLTSDQLLWVQVRSTDQATAAAVLASVATPGA